MFKNKIDGIVEGVKYSPDGKIEYVRAYLRRDMAYSDVIILQRDELIHRLDSGEKIFTGKRKKFLGSSFDTHHQIQLIDVQGDRMIQAGETGQTRDYLEGVPIF